MGVKVEIVCQQVVRYSRRVEIPVDEFDAYQRHCDLNKVSVRESNRWLNEFAERWIDVQRDAYDWDVFDDVQVEPLHVVEVHSDESS